MLLYGVSPGLKCELRVPAGMSCALVTQQLVLPRTKRISCVHNFLQVLLLGKNWQREAADHQQDDSEYQAFHITPSRLTKSWHSWLSRTPQKGLR